MGAPKPAPDMFAHDRKQQQADIASRNAETSRMRAEQAAYANLLRATYNQQVLEVRRAELEVRRVRVADQRADESERRELKRAEDEFKSAEAQVRSQHDAARVAVGQNQLILNRVKQFRDATDTFVDAARANADVAIKAQKAYVDAYNQSVLANRDNVKSRRKPDWAEALPRSMEVHIAKSYPKRRTSIPAADADAWLKANKVDPTTKGIAYEFGMRYLTAPDEQTRQALVADLNRNPPQITDEQYGNLQRLRDAVDRAVPDVASATRKMDRMLQESEQQLPGAIGTTTATTTTPAGSTVTVTPGTGATRTAPLEEVAIALGKSPGGTVISAPESGVAGWFQGSDGVKVGVPTAAYAEANPGVRMAASNPLPLARMAKALTASSGPVVVVRKAPAPSGAPAAASTTLAPKGQGRYARNDAPAYSGPATAAPPPRPLAGMAPDLVSAPDESVPFVALPSLNDIAGTADASRAVQYLFSDPAVLRATAADIRSLVDLKGGSDPVSRALEFTAATDKFGERIAQEYQYGSPRAYASALKLMLEEQGEKFGLPTQGIPSEPALKVPVVPVMQSDRIWSKASR